MVRGRDRLDELLGRMKENGIDDAFVIGGDATPPHGPYNSAVELLPIIHEHQPAAGHDRNRRLSGGAPAHRRRRPRRRPRRRRRRLPTTSPPSSASSRRSCCAGSGDQGVRHRPAGARRRAGDRRSDPSCSRSRCGSASDRRCLFLPQAARPPEISFACPARSADRLYDALARKRDRRVPLLHLQPPPRHLGVAQEQEHGLT